MKQILDPAPPYYMCSPIFSFITLLKKALRSKHREVFFVYFRQLKNRLSVVISRCCHATTWLYWIVKRQQYLSQLLRHFWQRWNKKYLADLREFYRSIQPTKTERQIEVGEIVLVQEEDLQRSKWKIGRVEELLRNHEGEVRGVKLRVLNKKGKPTVLR